MSQLNPTLCQQCQAVHEQVRDCSFDLLGWSERGYFDHFFEQVKENKCSQEIQPKDSKREGAVCRGDVPLDAFRACGRRKIKVIFSDVFTLSSIWISAGSSRMAYQMQFIGTRTNWYREGMAVNLSSMSGWHSLPPFTARQIELHAPTGNEGKQCVCLALRGCGRLRGRPSPSFRQLFTEAYPVFGMQLLLNDVLQTAFPSAPPKMMSPCDQKVQEFVEAMSWQLKSPAARLKPLDQLVHVMSPDVENCSPLMRAKLEAAKVLLESPQVMNSIGEELPVDELQLQAALEQVQRAERFIRLAEADLCGGHTDLWHFLHRAHLRLRRVEPELSGQLAPHDVRTLFHHCPGVPYTGQFGADRWALEEVFCCKRGGVYVDVGAASSWVLSNTYAMDAFLDWQGMCIDAIFEDPEGFFYTRSCEQVQQPVWTVSGEKRTQRYSKFISSHSRPSAKPSESER